MRRALAIVFLLALSLAPSTQAAYDPLGSGTTRLNLDKGFQALLKRNGVRLTARSPARVVGQKAAILPVSGGKVDPTIGKGTIELGGELLLQTKRKRVPLTDLMVKSKSPSPLYAKVGGGQQKLTFGAKPTFKRKGFDAELLATGLKLSAKTAMRLNKRLDLEIFNEGRPLGSLQSTAKPKTVTVLPDGRATLIPDPAMLAKFESLFVSLNPIAPAELAPGPLFSFPIARGGAIAPDASLGTLRTGGSIELLQLGAGQVFQHEYWLDFASKATSAEVDIEPAPTFPGRLGRIAVLGIEMAPAAVSSNPKARTITVSGTPLTLDASTAASFNEAFARGKGVFGAGERFGAVSFTARGQ